MPVVVSYRYGKKECGHFLCDINNVTTTTSKRFDSSDHLPTNTVIAMTVASKRFERSDHFPTTTVIVITVTSFIIGISVGFFFIWFVFSRPSSASGRKNKVRPSQCDVEVLECPKENGSLTEVEIWSLRYYLKESFSCFVFESSTFAPLKSV